MRIIRAIAAAAVVLAGLALPAPAHADGIPARPFYADSGDSCTYGYTRGTLIWRSPGPMNVIAVDVSGSVVDRPTLAEPTLCRDDGFYTIATFTAYSGRAAVDRRAVKADNGEEPFQFILGGNSAASGLTHLVVQVCRSPLVTLPPSYCGKPVTYYPTVIGPA
ncbi:MAG: hypothetical protein IRZ05_04570 [Micromonosporaceae bacterium]|jgi:hypothetical protein|nr:hypothetical protein [Micromonosporaceae bacterium]